MISSMPRLRYEAAQDIGRILKALKDGGLYDDSPLIFLSRHWDYAGGYGGQSQETCAVWRTLGRAALSIR